MSERTYLVVPFERIGQTIGPSHAFVFAAAEQAKQVARQLAPRVPGIAVLERAFDPETGDDVDTLIAGIGAVPPRFPENPNSTLRLN